MFALLSGILFLLIIVVLSIAGEKYGYEVFSEYNAEAKLNKINENPQKFRTAITVVVFEHVIIVVLSISMFLAFGSYSIILGLIWLLARSIEGVLQINNKRTFIGLADIAAQYSSSSETEKEDLENKTLSLLKSKNSIFTVAQLLFSIGTFAYSLVFVMYAIIPILIGWLGIVTSIVYGLGNAVYRIKPSSKILWNIGGLLIFLFELILGGWLVISSFVAL
jgi:hypothetical protein